VRVVRDFRFSTNVFGIDSGDGFAETCRRLEGFGYHTLFAADHLGLPAPFPVLVAAAGGHRAVAGRHARAQRDVLEFRAARP
jgi:hypothetical protein